jgi:uncharacterized protein YaaQ
MSEQLVDRLVLIVLSGSQSGALTKGLQQERFYFTIMDSSGGMFNEPTVCLILGLGQERLPILLELVREHCQPYTHYIPTQARLPGELQSLSMVAAQVGGALVYVMDVERFEQI